MNDSTTEARINGTWALLVGLTMGAWLLATVHGDGVGSASGPETVAVIAIAGVKARLILREYMEVRAAPPRLALAVDAALVAVLAALAGLYALA